MFEGGVYNTFAIVVEVVYVKITFFICALLVI